MAQTFDSVIVTDIGNTDKTLFTTPSKKTILIGCNFANKTTYELPISLWVRRGSTNGFIAKDHRVASGQNTDIIKGKLVLDAGDTLMARCPLDSAFDAHVSLLTGVD